MVEDLLSILTGFVAIAGTIDYGYKLIKLLVKAYEKFKNPYRRRRK